MVKWHIEVYTDNNYYVYKTNSSSQKKTIVQREKAKIEVVSIFVNRIRCYKRK